jgi:hypothetical protein
MYATPHWIEEEAVSVNEDPPSWCGGPRLGGTGARRRGEDSRMRNFPAVGRVKVILGYEVEPAYPSPFYLIFLCVWREEGEQRSMGDFLRHGRGYAPA